jgi:hypothetical protein
MPLVTRRSSRQAAVTIAPQLLGELTPAKLKYHVYHEMRPFTPHFGILLRYLHAYHLFSSAKNAFRHRRMPQNGLTRTSYFQPTMTMILNYAQSSYPIMRPH